MATLPDYASQFPRTLPRLWTFGDPPLYSLAGGIVVAAIQIPPGGVVPSGEDILTVDWASIPASAYVAFNSAHQKFGDVQALYDASGHFQRYAKITTGTKLSDVVHAISFVGGFALGFNQFLPVDGGLNMGDFSFDFSGASFTAPSFTGTGDIGSVGDGMGDWGPEIDYGNPGAGTVDVPNSGDVDFSDAQNALDSWNAQLDPSWSQQTGAVTADQFSSMVNMDNPAVKQAAKTALSKAGSASNGTPTAQQIQAAQNFARQQAMQSTDPQQKAMWQTASNFLGSFGSYNGTAGIKTASTWTTPTQMGQIVRQPDGSISVRNADGTVTTIGPNGVTKNTPLGQKITSFVTANPILVIGGAVAGIVAISMLVGHRR